MRRLKRRFVRLFSLGLLLALAATGCQEVPSYAVRWRIAPRAEGDQPPTAEPQDEEMTSPTVCARAGVSQVEVLVFDELDLLADWFQRPCFPTAFLRKGRAVRGATLPPGDYTAFVVGTRASDAPWGTCPDAPDGVVEDDEENGGILPEPGDDMEDDVTGGGGNSSGSCSGRGVIGFFDAAREAQLDFCVDGQCNPELGLDTCDCDDFTVTAETVRRIPDFTLAAPPDCEDGIDGDEDGLVDQLDPGCQLGDNESTPILTPELALDVSILSGNPNALCKSIAVGSLALEIDGQPIDGILCNVGITRLATPLAIGAHELSVTGVGSSGDAVTIAKTVAFDVNERGVTEPSVIEVDFADVDLLEPLESTIKFAPMLRLPDDAGTVTCQDPRVAVDDFRLRLLDLGGDLVRPVLNTSSNVRLNGESSVCEPTGAVSLASNVSTFEVVRWGGYLLEFEAYNSDGELCWSNADAPTPLEPADPVNVIADPVDGAPASCFGG